MKLRKITAFSLIELSIVILVIGLLIAGAIQGSNMISKAALSSARTLTESSPVNSIRSLFIWFDSTSKANFSDTESNNNSLISTWFPINPTSTSRNIAIYQHTINRKPKYISNAINNLPAVQLDGLNDGLYTSLSTGANAIINSFSVFVVAQANAPHEIDGESNSGTVGTSGQKFLLSPTLTTTAGFAGAGISMGTNGISFYEHAPSYMPALLVYSAALSKPLVLLMEYNNKTPKLYINGTLVKIGLTSSKNVVPPYAIGGSSAGSAYGVMSGYVGEVIIFSEVLKASDRDYVTDYLKKKWVIK